MSMEQFKYDDHDTFENNFARWHYANTVEREMYRDRILSKEEAYNRFVKYWGYKYTNPVRARRPSSILVN